MSIINILFLQTHSLKCSSHLLLEDTETVIADLWWLASIVQPDIWYHLLVSSSSNLIAPWKIRRDTFCLWYLSALM